MGNHLPRRGEETRKSIQSGISEASETAVGVTTQHSHYARNNNAKMA